MALVLSTVWRKTQPKGPIRIERVDTRSFVRGRQWWLSIEADLYRACWNASDGTDLLLCRVNFFNDSRSKRCRVWPMERKTAQFIETKQENKVVLKGWAPWQMQIAVMANDGVAPSIESIAEALEPVLTELHP